MQFETASKNAVTRRRVIGSDAAIGVITTASFALGLALFALFGTTGRSFDAALFGSILGVGTEDVVAILVVCVLAGALIFLRYRALLFVTFDPEVAPIYGVNIGVVDTLFALAMAATIVASINVVGVTLIAATLVIPATSARMLTDSFGRMLGAAALVGAVVGAAAAVGLGAAVGADVGGGGAADEHALAASATTVTRIRTQWLRI
jgi:manganese/iron transport system permease protein/iron/zinc/copper transport system permease protein